LPPPKDFDPLTASNEDLLSYGHPPRPSKTKNPKLRALWEAQIARGATIITPKFKVGECVHAPPERGLRGIFEDGDPNANATSNNWSGAVQTIAPSGQSFWYAFAKWTVPSAYPPPTAKTSTGWKDGTYYAYSWVGIDGYFNSPPQVFQAGTASTVTVSNGSISSTSYFGWHEWYPAGLVQWAGFSVGPGDLIEGVVFGTPGSKVGQVLLINLTRNISSGVLQITAPAGYVLKGIDAEWIMEDPSGFYFPNYGVEVFFDCFAESISPDGTKYTNFNLSGSTLVNAVQTNVPVSTAIAENATTLVTYAYNDGP
jgi:Peptidase A4 family